jgi:UDP-N-acetylglucosamine 2-epimerase (non-hydrolysing)
VLSGILAGLDELTASLPIIFPAHPRTHKRIREFGLENWFQWTPPAPLSNEIHITQPLGYADFLALMQAAAIVVTDSGGIQEETTCLGVPCVTVRQNTERPVTVYAGTNVLAGISSDGIRSAIRRQTTRIASTDMIPEKWDGATAERITAILFECCTSAAVLAASPAVRVAEAYVRS